ncbi:MAG: TlyA family RNA methyltransferase [Oscillospiraceae bacterium]|nr:TlyA family RNA methyltransferase [Oscillospiraceae bacterium]
MGDEKIRLDAALVERGLAPSREKAKALIMAGAVDVGGLRELKPGRVVKRGEEIDVRGGKVLPFVSRGGAKLQKAVEAFGLQLRGKVCMDIGASTGGFTDCMLLQGAARVYAIDVGYGQLAWKLRSDERVICLERTNFRYVTQAQIPEPIAFASVDVSFISLRLIFPALLPLLAEDGQAVCLIKPQFEAGRTRVGKKGVVRDPAVQRDVVETILKEAMQAGFFSLGLDFSPIKGPEGNIEFLLWLGKQAQNKTPLPCLAEEVVACAIAQLGESDV